MGGWEVWAEGLVEELEGLIALGGEVLDVVAELVELGVTVLAFLFEFIEALFEGGEGFVAGGAVFVVESASAAEFVAGIHDGGVEAIEFFGELGSGGGGFVDLVGEALCEHGESVELGGVLEEGGLLAEESFEVVLAVGEILNIPAEELGFGELAAEGFVMELEVVGVAAGFVALAEEYEAEGSQAEAEEECGEGGEETGELG